MARTLGGAEAGRAPVSTNDPEALPDANQPRLPSAPHVAGPTVDSYSHTHYQNLYLEELYALLVVYLRATKYAQSQGRWVTLFAALRAVASSGAIATWAIVQSNGWLSAA